MNHRCIRVMVTLVAMLAMVSPAAYAQGGGSTSAISGTVTDSSGAVIPGATVIVKNNGTAAEYQAVTSDEGTFTIPALNPGSYTITVTLMGFKTAQLNDVRLNAGVPTGVTLKLEVGGLEETIVVEGGASVIQTQTAAVTSTIDVNQIAKLPTGSRSALDFVASLPGVNTPAGSRNSTINGLPERAINITIDGMSAQDNYLKTTDGFFARVSPRLDAVEEVTVSTAAQGAATTGQGAAQIQFTTRSGSNRYTGSSYYYLQHYKLNANTWFNNRDLAPDPGTGKAPKPEDVLHQPGTRVGGPVSIPGLFDGRDKLFFFVNYEESRSPGQNAEDRTILHPLAQQGIFRYDRGGGQIQEVNLLNLAAQNGFTSTLDPTIERLLGDIRASTGGQNISDVGDPITQEFRYLYDTEGITRYPTVRIDWNVTQKHKLTGSWNFTKLLSTPDTTNNREPNFPGFPGTGNQHSERYTIQGTLRSTLTTNLVNEFKVGRTGGATLFSPEISPAQYTGPVANQGGYLLDINGDFLGITNAHSTVNYSAREAGTKVVENTLSWVRGAHNFQVGGAFTEATVWLENQQHVPTITFGINAADPAQAMFSSANFPNASTNQLNDARELYATLVGRVIGIAAEARLDENTDEYRYLGLGMQRARLRDVGFFVADSWRWRPNFTFNYGLRYALQSPFTPTNNSYSKATYEDVCGVSGVNPQGGCNLFAPGAMPGRTPQFVQFNKGEGAYNTDYNNFAPSVGFAWTLPATGGILGGILGREEGDSVVRAGYAIAYDRPGMNDFTGGIDDNPGISISATRSVSNGLLGTPGSILLRNTSDLGPPPLPTTRVYPMTDIVTEDVHIYDPDLQVPYSQTWTAGWQRKLNRDMAVEARYVGTRSLQGWTDYNFNEVNIVENGFLDEFRRAQSNLAANIAAGRGNTFAYTGAPGTVPLPIYLAYFTGRPASQSNVPASYSGTLWTSSTFVNPLARFNPQPITAADALDADAGRRQNALNAGLPANFLVANPNLLGGAEVTGNGGYTKYNSLQLEFRKRLSHGFQFQTSYVFGRAFDSARYSFRYPRRTVYQTGDPGGVSHAFKANWVFEMPFGRGRRFVSNANGFVDRLVGGWELDGIARIQTGRELNFGNVRLVGMSDKEFQDAFKLRFDDANRLVYMLPQDIIDNTVSAFDVSATSATGYGSRGAPTGRYLAPANGPDCIEIGQTNAITGFGECGINSLVVRGPMLYVVDLSAVKRTQIAGRVNFEFRAEMLNAFNTPWFTPVTGAVSNLYNNPTGFRVTGTTGSAREVQLVFRVNW